jgi:hypothetical protein
MMAVATAFKNKKRQQLKNYGVVMDGLRFYAVV